MENGELPGSRFVLMLLQVSGTEGEILQLNRRVDKVGEGVVQAFLNYEKKIRHLGVPSYTPDSTQILPIGKEEEQSLIHSTDAQISVPRGSLPGWVPGKQKHTSRVSCPHFLTIQQGDASETELTCLAHQGRAAPEWEGIEELEET